MSGIDKLKNAAEKLAGQGKEKTGEATGNEDLRAEGQGDQASGDLNPDPPSRDCVISRLAR